MKYKALFLDVDGTLVPYVYDALPSDTVAKAVQKAQEKVTVCLVTGRSFGFIKPVLEKLDITSGYAVVNTGAVIVDLLDETVAQEQPILPSDIDLIFEVFHKENLSFYLKDAPLDRSRGIDITKYEQECAPKTTYMLFTDETHEEEKIDRVLEKLSESNTLNVHKTTHKDPTKFGVNITHVNATKLQGVQFLLDKLQLKREEVIGVGDSYNDFPLLMASGLKVAMGNAIDDLKQIADYVAPPVTEDGVAQVIERFILNNNE